jgi:hypothetical protein
VLMVINYWGDHRHSPPNGLGVSLYKFLTMRSMQNQLAAEVKIDGRPLVAEGRGWKYLYMVAAYAALVMVFFIPVQMLVYFLWPPPETVSGWFELFHKNAIIGLLDMDLLLSVDYLLLAVIFLAFYVILNKYEPSLMAIALTLQLLAISIYFASTAAFEMLSLSKLYSIAGTEEEKNQLLVTGQAMLVTWQGTAFNISYIVGGLALLIVSFVMYRTDVFGRTIANLGIFMGILMMVPPTIGMIGVIISLVSLIPLVPWLVLLARRFFELSNEADADIIM